MDAAVDQVIEEKFGAGGTYADAEVFAPGLQGHGDGRDLHEARRRTRRPRRSSTRRRSAATWWRPTGASRRTPTPSTCPGIWVQFSHLEIEYYERFGEPARTRSAQAEGREIWDRVMARRPPRRQRDRPDDRPDAASRRSGPQWVLAAADRASSRGALRPVHARPHPAVQLHQVRALDDRAPACRARSCTTATCSSRATSTGPGSTTSTPSPTSSRRTSASRGGAGVASPARRPPSR